MPPVPFVQVIHKQANEIEQVAERNHGNEVRLQIAPLTAAVLLLVKTIATIAGRHDG